MIFKLLNWLEEFFRTQSKTPWAKFSTAGIENGTVRYDMTWNPAFLENLRSAGFTGHNEQEIVEMFFLGSLIIPKDDALNAENGVIAVPSTPLVSESNRLKRG